MAQSRWAQTDPVQADLYLYPMLTMEFTCRQGAPMVGDQPAGLAPRWPKAGLG